MSVKENVLHLCEKGKIRPGTLEKKIGLSNATIRRWTDDTKSTGETLEKIADYFNVSVDFLLDREHEAAALPPDEAELLGMFRCLTKEGKELVTRAADAAYGNPNLRKKEAASVTA